MKKAMMLFALLGMSAAAWSGVVTWQLDMNVQEGLGNFNPGNGDQVFVRGSFNGWGGYNPELFDGDNDGIYVGSYDMAAVPDGPHEYKYVMLPNGGMDIWEFVGNRPMNLDGSDMLMPVEFFNDIDTLPGVCDVEITFQVDMNVQIATGGFDPMTQGVFYRGPYNGWGDYNEQLSDIGGGIYAIELPFFGQDEASCIEHKFVIADSDGLGGWGGDNWESSPNRCGYSDCTWSDTDADGLLEGTLDAVFFADIDWGSIIDHDVLVTFNVDAWPVKCWYQNNDPAGMGWPYEDLGSYEAVSFISVHGFFNGWPGWDGMIDSQYHLQPAGGTLWSGSVLFPVGSGLEQVYKYGANGFDNEAGFGADHSINLNDDMGTGVLVVNDIFGELGDYWPLIPCDDVVEAEELPGSFMLAQNHPNPFNPGTTIAFSIEATGPASLTVYDLTGSKVATLVNGMMNAGNHEIAFDASNLSSGVYVYTLQAGDRVESRKMVLVK